MPIATASRDYRRRFGSTPNAAALADALTALAGEAQDCASEPVCLRVARHGGAIVTALGDATGRAVVVRPGGWELADVSPVLFRRTALTAALPEPRRGGDLKYLSGLRDLLNVSTDSWAMTLGVAVASYIPDIPHPVVKAGGQEGSGKTSWVRAVVSLTDPSAAPVRSQPADVESWALAAAGSWVVAVDYVSYIAPWWSASLCKAVTGDGWVRRKLYTDGELAVVSFRRVAILTAIDAGALRGDLGDRLLLIDLDPIDDRSHRTEAELDAVFAERRPAIFGALLDVLAAVLDRLPSVELPTMPRMADFARVLAAMDGAIGTRALPAYLAQRGRIADDIVESDPVGVAVVAFVRDVGSWIGTASDLLDRIKPEKPGREFPKSGRGLSGRLRRLIPALVCAGVEAVPPAESDKSRRWAIERTGDSTAQTAQPPERGPGDAENAGSDRAVDDDRPPNRPSDRPTESGSGAIETGDSWRSGGSDGWIGQHSDEAADAASGPAEPGDAMTLRRCDAIGGLDVPMGWTRDGWRLRLYQLAERCEAINAARSAELREWARRLDGPA